MANALLCRRTYAHGDGKNQIWDIHDQLTDLFQRQTKATLWIQLEARFSTHVQQVHMQNIKVQRRVHHAGDRLLGVHIVGPRAGDLIAEAAVAIDFCASAEDGLCSRCNKSSTRVCSVSACLKVCCIVSKQKFNTCV